MRILGIKPNIGNGRRASFPVWGAHDGAAVLLEDSNILAAVEEERFTREKRAEFTFPTQSIQHVLESQNLSLAEIDAIGVGRYPPNYITRAKQNPRSLLPHALSPGGVYFALTDLATLVSVYKGAYADHLDFVLREEIGEGFDGNYHFIPHHKCHAASALYCASDEAPLVMTMDGQGEHDSTVIWSETLDREREFSWHNSIGRFYQCGVSYLGYRGGQDAGKVMGLASYGEYREEFDKKFSELVSFGNGSYDVTTVTPGPNSGYGESVALLEDYFGRRREYPDKFTQRHKDFAYHLQKQTEEIVLHLVNHYLTKYNKTSVAMAGGVAMNCKLNRQVKNHRSVNDFFAQPAANDTGISLGAALQAHRCETGTAPDIDLKHTYFGPSYSSDAIASKLDHAKINARQPDDICKAVAKELADGKLVGWFQGRMEFGARALGNRSILADPRTRDSLDRINRNVKNREPWRPFAPSLKYEAKDEYLVDGTESPFMILLDEVAPEKRDDVPAIVHADNTTRPQTVRKETNPRYHSLLDEFEAISGVPVLLNTSFNVAGEPIVESPDQAINDFYNTGLDVLALGDYVLTKK